MRESGTGRDMQHRFPHSFENIIGYEPIAPMKIEFGYKVIQGGRPNTEDYADVRALTTRGFLPLTVGIVADGVGGNVFGEEASRETVETVMRYIEESPLSDPNGIPILLEFALQEANRCVIQRSRAEREKQGMATTAIVAAIYENLVFVANVGDSRAYIVRGEQLLQISIDHSWENEVVREGRYTFEESSKHPKANELKRSIGTTLDLVVDHGFYFDQDLTKATNLNGSAQIVWPLQANERLLLCSDGLIKGRHDQPGLPYVTDDEIVDAVLSHLPEMATAQLSDLAQARRVDDNVSVVILEPAGSKRQKRGKTGQRSIRPLLFGLASVALLLIVGLLAIGPSNLFGAESPEISAEPLAETLAPADSGASSAVTERSTVELSAQMEDEEASIATEVNFGDEFESVAADGLRIIPTEYQSFLVSGQNLISLPSKPGEMLLSIEDGAFEIQNPFGGSGLVEPIGGKGLLGIVYQHDPYSFEVHCLIGKCQIAGDVDGIQLLQAGEMSHVGSSGTPGDPDVADFGRFVILSDDVPTLTPTPSATPTSTPTATHTPTIAPSPTPAANGTPDPAGDGGDESLPNIAPFDPDGDGVLHDPDSGLYDLCQDEVGSPGTCGCPEESVPASCTSVDRNGEDPTFNDVDPEPENEPLPPTRRAP